MITFNEYMEKRSADELIYEAAVLTVELGMDPALLNEELRKLGRRIISEADDTGAPATPAVAPNSAMGGWGNAASAAGSGLGRLAQGVWTGMKDMWKGSIPSQLNSAIRSLTTFYTSIKDAASAGEAQTAVAHVIETLNGFKAQAQVWQKERENKTRSGAMHPGIAGHPGMPAAAPAGAPPAGGDPAAAGATA